MAVSTMVYISNGRCGQNSVKKSFKAGLNFHIAKLINSKDNYVVLELFKF